MSKINFGSRKLYDLDKILATSGLFLALILILASFIVDRPMYIVVGFILLLTCTIYFYINKGEPSYILSQLERKASTRMLLNIFFFSLLAWNMMSLYSRPNPYVRPSSYFISMFLMISVIVTDILFLPNSKSYTVTVLLKVMIIPFSIVWSQLLIFPVLVSGDPWVHQMFTQSILDSGFIPEGFIYSRLPIYHLMIAATRLVTDLGHKMATILSISLIQLICLVLFTFLLGRWTFNAKVGLLGALLLGFSGYFIHISFYVFPNTLSAVPILIIVYLLFKLRRNKPLIASSLSILFMLTLILTHALASMCMTVLLFVGWLGFEVYNLIYREDREVSLPLSIAIPFTIAMFAWWTYVSGHVAILGGLIKWGFSGDYWNVDNIVYPASVIYTHNVPFFELLFNSAGNYLFWGLSFAGCFYMISRKVKNPYAFNIAVYGMVISLITFFALVFSFTGILTGRWHYFSHIFLSIPLAVALFLLSSGIRGVFAKVSVVVIIIIILSFLTLMTPLSNMDNPIFKNTLVDGRLTVSEVHSLETISEFTDDKLGAEPRIVGYLEWIKQFPPERTFSIQESLYTKDFSNYKDSIVIIGKRVSQATISVNDRSFIELDYNPRPLLTEEGFSCIYDSGSVSGFYWNRRDLG
ncbi:hypothetical protein ES702_00077 [subsurface metagenome]